MNAASQANLGPFIRELDPSPPTLPFYDYIDPGVALTILQMSKMDRKRKFKADDVTIDEPEKWARQEDNILNFCRLARKHGDGKIPQKYEYGKGIDYPSRQYCKGQPGIQSLNSAARSALCYSTLDDYDICNCHPSFYLYVCKEWDIPNHSRLEAYCNDRETFLQENDCTKRDVLIALNSDNPKRKRDRVALNDLAEELKQIKFRMQSHAKFPSFITSNNATNPISSRCWYYISSLECQVVWSLCNIFGESASVPMLDGLMVRKDFCPDAGKPGLVARINELLREPYHGCIQITMKPMTCVVEVSSELRNVKTKEECYEIINANCFWLRSPPTYMFKAEWRENGNNRHLWQQQSKADIETQFAQLRVVNDDDKLVSAFSLWNQDVNRREYNTMNLHPYGKNDVSPDVEDGRTFNRFEPWTMLEYFDDDFEPIDTDNFDQLIRNLTGNIDDEHADWLMDFLAHMLQYPEDRPEQAVLLEGTTGTGKDTLHTIVEALIGHHYAKKTADPDKIFGNFNSLVMSDCMFLLINEFGRKASANLEDSIKALVTDKQIALNGKFTKMSCQNLYARMVFASNNNGIRIEPNDRRFVSFCTSDKLCIRNYPPDSEEARDCKQFWTQMHHDIKDEEWVASLFYKLWTRDIEDFDPNKEFMTSHKMAQMELSQTHYDKFMLRWVMDENERVLDDADRRRDFGLMKFPANTVSAAGRDDCYIIQMALLHDRFKQYLIHTLPDIYGDQANLINKKPLPSLAMLRTKLSSISHCFYSTGKNGIGSTQIKVNGNNHRYLVVYMDKLHTHLVNCVFRNLREDAEPNDTVTLEEANPQFAYGFNSPH